MSSFALGLVLISAVAHATWNLYAKRASGGPAFVWLLDVAATLLYAPLALIVVLRPHAPLTPLGYGFIAGSAVLLSDASARLPDRRPLARLPAGTRHRADALDDRRDPRLRGAAGAAGARGRGHDRRRHLCPGGGAACGRQTPAAVAFALLSGAIIASYTLWDKRAVSNLGIPPLPLNWSLGLGRVGQAAK